VQRVRPNHKQRSFISISCTMMQSQLQRISTFKLTSRVDSVTLDQVVPHSNLIHVTYHIWPPTRCVAAGAVGRGAVDCSIAGFCCVFGRERAPPPWVRHSWSFPIATRLQPSNLHLTPPPCCNEGIVRHQMRNEQQQNLGNSPLHSTECVREPLSHNQCAHISFHPHV